MGPRETVGELVGLVCRPRGHRGSHSIMRPARARRSGFPAHRENRASSPC